MVSFVIKVSHCDACVVLLGKDTAATHQDAPVMIDGETYEVDLCDTHWSTLIKPLQVFLRANGREPEKPRRHRAPVIDQLRPPKATTNQRLSEPEEDRTCYECGFDDQGKAIYVGPTVAALIGHLRPKHDLTLNQMRKKHNIPIKAGSPPERPFKCPGCNRTFGTFERVHDHARNDHGQTVAQDSESNIIVVATLPRNDQGELPTADQAAEAWQAFVGRPDEPVIEESEPVGANG